MRSGFSVTLIVVILFAGGYFYNLAQAVCPVPLTYKVGEIDARFELPTDEAKVAVAQAAEIWEKTTGQNLFSYDDEAAFTINFIFDERQALINEEMSFTEKLEDAEGRNEVLTITYEALVEQYEDVKSNYEREVDRFEERLATYNDTVAKYNAEQGAPPEVYAELQAERAALDAKRLELDRAANRLNIMVSEINEIGQKGNQLIANYNEHVGEFNQRFGEAREFTQGDYQSGRINIYTYKDEWELQTVLAHELGHALSLDHVESAASVMHHLIGGQPAELTLSSEDLAEFNRVCGNMNLWDKIVYRLSHN